MPTNFEIGKVFGDVPPTDPTQAPTTPLPTDPEPTQPTAPQPTDPQPTNPESQVVTLYFSNSVFWGNVYAYAWRTSDEHMNQAWPGEQLTSIGKNSYGEEIYSITIDLSEYDNIILATAKASRHRISRCQRRPTAWAITAINQSRTRRDITDSAPMSSTPRISSDFL